LTQIDFFDKKNFAGRVGGSVGFHTTRNFCRSSKEAVDPADPFKNLKSPVNMALDKPKYSIFEAMAGPNENRFVAFDDTTEVNSKFKKGPVCDFSMQEGREKDTQFNRDPL